MFCLVSLVSFVALVVAYNLIKGKYGTKISVQGKSVMITGCDSGVGLSMALFAQDVGFDVIATCLSISSTGAELLRSKNIFVIKMDVTRVEDVEDARQVVGSHLRKNNLSLWALINNAGVLVFGHFDWQVETQMLQQINVNLIGAMRVTKAFLPFLRHSRGRIINVSSANGRLCVPGLPIYCASKHGLEGFSNTLRMELSPWNVIVILFNPGDLPKRTMILMQQSRHAELMEASLTLEEKETYGGYFECFHQHIKKLFENPSIGQLDDPGLQKCFESSILEENPKHYYENLSPGFKLFLFIFKMIPVSWADKLMLNMWGGQVGWNWDTMERSK